MDTKLKNWMYSKALKRIAALALIFVVAAGAVMVGEILQLGIEEDYIPTLTESWKDNRTSAAQIADTMDEILDAAVFQDNKAAILAGDTITSSRLIERWGCLYDEKWYSFCELMRSKLPQDSDELEESYQWNYMLNQDMIQITKSNDGKITASLKSEDLSDIQRNFEERYREETAQFPQKEIEAALSQLERNEKQKDQLLKTPGLAIQVKNSNGDWQNTDEGIEYFKKLPVSLIITKGECRVQIDSEIKTPLLSEYSAFPMENRYYWRNVSTDTIGADDVIMIGLTKDYIATISASLAKNYAITVQYAESLSIILLLVLALLIYLTVVCGREEPHGKITLLWVDKIFTEINFIILCGIVTAYCMGGYALVRYHHQKLIFPGAVLLNIIFFALYFSGIRRIKDRTFFKNCAIYRFLGWIFCKTRTIFQKVCNALTADGAPKRVVWAIVLYGLICMLTAIVFPVTLALIIGAAIFAYRRAVSYQKICEGVADLRRGNLQYQINVDGDKIFSNLAEDINGLGEGLHAAIDKELKSERMKSELVTNVSHDIRTPLTSIITYVDLIEKEGVSSENAPGYFEIIASKAQRLKTLTDDLFEVSKAASGTIPIVLEDVDLSSLLRQGMGELDDKIEASDLDFRLKLPKEHVWVRADGKQLWRVIENLFSNVFKYAMPSSRVYLEIQGREAEVSFEMKNISAYELNDIEASELTERFKRGDLSRQSEGSGLGLAIAKNLVELQHGTFHVTVDGDLFKVTILLPRAAHREEPIEQQNEE